MPRLPARAGEVRSIPARAGEAAARRGLSASAFTGPSPPVRGKQQDAARHSGGDRSIPARAGEAAAFQPLSRLAQVHPRPCGGSILIARWEPAREGPSPPVRGKPRRSGHGAAGSRSIPARAGEALRRDGARIINAVHPRPCGGSQPAVKKFIANRGVHPRPCGGSPT